MKGSCFFCAFLEIIKGSQKLRLSQRRLRASALRLEGLAVVYNLEQFLTIEELTLNVMHDHQMKWRLSFVCVDAVAGCLTSTTDSGPHLQGRRR